jgi:hypothetical protein
MNRNDPNINRKYNYVYKITNKINGKIYIGVHRTDNINDNYMGSGKIIKRSQNKHGIENFSKEILYHFNTYKEALNEERQIVTPEFIERDDNYNIKEGGFGACRWSSDVIEHLTQKGKDRWNDPIFIEKMMIALRNDKRCIAIGNKVKSWIKNNPDEHKLRMDKINKNPSKIEKTRLKHLGTTRSVEACANISKGLNDKLNGDPLLRNKICGKGMSYIYNKETDTLKRITPGDEIPIGWVKGSRPMKGKRNYNICKNLLFAYDPITLYTHRYSGIENIPFGYIRGRPKNG